MIQKSVLVFGIDQEAAFEEEEEGGTCISDDYHGADGFLYVRPSSDQSEMALKWSNDGNFIVANNGKVLQANDPGGPVSLEDRKSDDLRQQWIIFNLKDGHENYEIRCLHENLRLDLIEDPSSSDVFKVGALPANNGRHYDQDTWKIEKITEGD